MHRTQMYENIFSPYFKGEIEVAVEVGTMLGANLKRMQSGLNPKKMYAIDPWRVIQNFGENYKPYGPDWQTDEELEKAYQMVLNWSKDYANVTLMRETSQEACEKFEDNSIDFIHIDGDHSYESVRNDINIWWQKVKKGGIMSGHDYCWGNARLKEKYGVIEAVNEFFVTTTIRPVRTVYTATSQPHPTWWVYKQP